jgi:uncharacterized protein YbjT (DUF2867 family)
MRAQVTGSTGLIGGELLKILAAEQVATLALARRAFSAPVGVRVIQADFAHLRPSSELTCSHAFCALGTTIKKAGSQEAFRQVDFDAVIASAKLAKECGASVFVVVSALGADAGSAIFYNRVKGEMEKAVKDIGFVSTYVLRPSLLVGERSESRLGEQVGNVVGAVFGPLMQGPLRKYRPIQGRDVARAMFVCARRAAPGFHILESDQIAATAQT